MEFDGSGFPAKWKISVSHSEVSQLSDAAWMASEAVPNEVTAACSAAMAYIEAVDFVGGNNGVDIYGSGVAGFVAVLPHGITLRDVVTMVEYVAAGHWLLQAKLLSALFNWGIHVLGSPRGSIHADEDG